MSVAAFVYNPSTEEHRKVYIPIATEGFFNKVWMPASETLGLSFVPLFSGGVVIGESEIKDVIEELERLRSLLEGKSQNDDTVKAVDRISRMIDEFPQIISPETSIYIG